MSLKVHSLHLELARCSKVSGLDMHRPFLHRSSEYALAKEAFDKRRHRQGRVLAKIQPSQLIAHLKGATDAVDEQSSELCATFTAGDMPVEAFVPQYIKLRTLYHERELKGQAALQML